MDATGIVLSFRTPKKPLPAPLTLTAPPSGLPQAKRLPKAPSVLTTPAPAKPAPYPPSLAGLEQIVADSNQNLDAAVYEAVYEATYRRVKKSCDKAIIEATRLAIRDAVLAAQSQRAAVVAEAVQQALGTVQPQHTDQQSTPAADPGPTPPSNEAPTSNGAA